MRYLAQMCLKILFWPIITLLYRIRTTGTENVPKEGGVLYLINHVSYIDAFIMFFSSPRPPRFVVLEDYIHVKAIAWFMKLFKAIPIRPSRSREAIERTAAALNEGDVVCLFPEGGLTRLGVPVEFKKGFQIIAKKADCVVVPVHMNGLFSSIFSFERNRYFKKWPRAIPCPIQVSFGKPIPGKEATAEAVREAVIDESVSSFALRPEFEKPLEVALVKALKKGRKKNVLIEHGKKGPREWSRAYTLGLATAMARRWANNPPGPGDRIGIMLPPGPMTAVINLGLFLAGKVPVNLPFTIDQKETEDVAKAIAPLGIRTVITSRAFMSHLMDFWHGDEGVFIDLKSVVSSPGSGMTLFERWRAYLEPAWLTNWRLEISKRPIDREAVGIVTRPGEKPLFLSSVELFKNATQVTAANFVQWDDTIYTELPMNTPEGLTLGCWSPILGTGSVVTRSLSRRDDPEALESAILADAATVVAGSDEFFRKNKQPLNISSLRYGIVFGPASHWEIEDWEEEIELPLARGWSSHGRVVTMSRTDPNSIGMARHMPQRGRDSKSVGHTLPGIGLRVDGGRIRLRFAPGAEELRGPRESEIAPDGLVFIRDIDLI